MTEAVIVSTARTPIAKAFRGAFNATGAPTLAAM
jgi:acetyl-CoA C-acetyltransferase